MASEELVLLLPCNHWDDFPLELDGHDADALLAAWTTLWDPRLLISLGGIPAWQPADSPPVPTAGMVALVPRVSRAAIPIGWLEELAEAGGKWVEAGPDRGALLRATMMELGVDATRGDPALAADLRALGFAYLQIQLLTRAMHYASHLDDMEFSETLHRSARAVLQAETSAAAEGIGRLFEMLVEARDHFYPVDAHLVDLTLLAPSTLGPDLAAELAVADDQAVPINLVASGQVIEDLAKRAPETLEQLRGKLARGTVDLAGGAYAEAALPDTTPEAILAQLVRGRETYRRYLSTWVTIYGCRHAGLAPGLPRILEQIGFQGVLHMAFDGRRLPTSEQCKTRWQGCDGTTIDALSGPPLDAGNAASFLRLARHMGESMDHDFVATVCLAHWPGRASPWYKDLKRITRYGPVLGRFVTLEDYFHQTETPDLSSQFTADPYRRDKLGEVVAAKGADPISAGMREFQDTLDGELDRTFRAMADLAAGCVAAEPVAGEDSLSPPPDVATGPDLAGDASRPSVSRRFLASLGPAEITRGPGQMVFNPLTHHQRLVLERDAESVDVPGMGFAWATGPKGRAQAAASNRDAMDVRLAEDHLLRNEYFEVTVNPNTGGIQAIWDYRRRGNRLSQQVAYRSEARGGQPGPGPRDGHSTAHYARMVAGSIEVTSAGPAVGEITSRGELVDGDGRRLAGFQQRLRVVRASRVIGLEIELDPTVLPEGPPWENYYAVRFAWPNGLADLCRSVTMDRQATELARFEAPHYVERTVDQYRVAILTCGLAYHCVSSPGTLDTLLLVRGETARSFQLGIGLQVAHPLHASLVHATQRAPRRAPSPGPPRAPRGWLLKVDAPNVAITACQPLCGSAAPDSAAPADGSSLSDTPGRPADRRVTGVRLRLLETEGKACRAEVRSFRDIGSARQTDFLGQPLAELVTDHDRLWIDLNPHQWVQVEAWW